MRLLAETTTDTRTMFPFPSEKRQLNMKTYWAIAVMLLSACHLFAVEPEPTAEQINPSVANIQRTMARIANSAPETPATVRWQFYGQSITAQAWTWLVEEVLVQRFPSVNFLFHNPAIGGFTPVAESWTLTCLPDSSPDAQRVHFRVEGAVTGQDGEGYSDEKFVSQSGRVVIDPEDWHLAWCLSYKRLQLPEGFQVTWETYPLFSSHYEASSVGTETVLVQNCSNGEHQLVLRSAADGIGLRSFRVYTPAENHAQ